MSSVECLREFMSERLTSAAEEIFRVFQRTIVDYEVEIDRQRRLLDIVWKPEIKLHRTELPQQHVCKEEEVLADQQFCDQDRNCSLDQEDPEPPQIKEEQEELYTSLKVEELVLKQETETFMLIPTCEESVVTFLTSEDQTLDRSPDETQSATEKEHVVSISVKSLVVPEPNSDDQLLSYNSHVAESQDHKGGKQGDSGSTGNAETKPQKRHHNSNSYTNDPEPPQIKEEQEELYTSLEVEELVLKQETETFMLTPTCEESDNGEDQTLDWSPDETESATEKEHVVSMSVKSSVVPNSDDWLLSHISHVAESQDHKGGKQVDSGSTSNTEPKRQKRHRKSKSHSNNVCNTTMSKFQTHKGKKILKCDTCGKAFKYISQLNRHLTIHTDEKPYSCNSCEKRFSVPGALTLHMKVHTGEKPYPCNTCGRRFTQMAKVKRHMRTHTELPQQHVCKEEEVLADQQLCNQERNSSLDQEDPEPPQIKEEQEELCTSLEGEQLVLKQEESDYSEDQTLDWSPDETQSAAEKEHVVSMSVKSSVVPNSDDRLLSHISHVAESQGHKRGKGVDSGSTRNLETKPQKRHHKSKSHSDNVCNTTMSKIQLDTQTGKKVLKCDTCGKAFKYVSQLNRHHRVHTGEKPYSCNSCERRFSLAGALKVHMRVHTGEKPYPCNTCGKRFSQITKVKKHMKTHTREKPYPCNICEKRFSHLGILKVHMRVHTGEKPYPCNTCEKRFSELGALKVHMRVHTGEKPYPCNICDKRFSQLVVLQTHMRIHTGEKPYSCNTCEKRFSQVGALQTHMRVHTGEKPYNCKTCGTDFMRRHQLKTHMRTHTVGKDSVRCQT
ncbi:zinc finger protein 271-like isoform X3 [Thunnus albacares]|uniref:zinc finger protein 271-like isoform X2 n=1 Tax=Thunnus albacares TaxID=8236 RepID=UPI001CF6BC5E|nr:zinc finger protein 271-like isoform X2 [Thunnus albacares]XP_044233074.1 zinc finger protein 271-like isoform X3 [Thunnus albacares]